MIRMIKGNVERIVASEGAAARFKAEGFIRMDAEESQEDAAHSEAKVPVETEEETALENLTINELRKIAKEKGINGSFSLSKADLLEVLKDVM